MVRLGLGEKESEIEHYGKKMRQPSGVVSQ